MTLLTQSKASVALSPNVPTTSLPMSSYMLCFDTPHIGTPLPNPTDEPVNEPPSPCFASTSPPTNTNLPSNRHPITTRAKAGIFRPR